MKNTTLILSVLLLIAEGCRKEEIMDTVFKISKGSHASTPHRNIRPLKRHITEGYWVFDSTCIYTPSIEQDQNKLTGLKFNLLKGGRYNVEMVSWRWLYGRLSLAPYRHVEGKTYRVGQKNFTGELPDSLKVACDIGERIYVRVEEFDDSIFYQIKSMKIAFKMAQHGSECWEVQPYFGGQATAPHDVFILKN